MLSSIFYPQINCIATDARAVSDSWLSCLLASRKYNVCNWRNAWRRNDRRYNARLASIAVSTRKTHRPL